MADREIDAEFLQYPSFTRTNTGRGKVGASDAMSWLKQLGFTPAESESVFKAVSGGDNDVAVKDLYNYAYKAVGGDSYVKPSAQPLGEGATGIQSLASLLQDAMGFMAPLANQSTQLGKTVLPEQYATELANQRQFLPQFQEIIQNLLTQGRTAELRDVINLAPMVSAAQKAGERQDVSAMRDLLGQQIYDALASGERLTPEQVRNVEQATRSSQIARGSASMGGGDIMREAVARALEGQDIASQRRAEARSFLTSEDARAADPFSVVLGMGSGSTGMALNNYNTGLRQPTTPSLVPALTQMGQQQNQQQYQAGLQAQQLALMQQYMPQIMGA